MLMWMVCDHECRRLSEKCLILPVRESDTLEVVTTKALGRLGRTMDHMLMSGRGLHVVHKNALFKLDYPALKVVLC